MRWPAPTAAMHDAPTYNLLSAHHLLYEVQTLIERAERYCVLVTPYVDLWPSLEMLVRQAAARGVAVHFITRAKDDTHFEKREAQRIGSLERLKALGAQVHEVPWLHTKLYLNEAEAIVTSFNLTATGRDGPNLGVHLHGAVAARDALKQLDQWLPGLPREIHTAACGHAPGAGVPDHRPLRACTNAGR